MPPTANDKYGVSNVLGTCLFYPGALFFCFGAYNYK